MFRKEKNESSRQKNPQGSERELEKLEPTNHGEKNYPGLRCRHSFSIQAANERAPTLLNKDQHCREKVTSLCHNKSRSSVQIRQRLIERTCRFHHPAEMWILLMVKRTSTAERRQATGSDSNDRQVTSTKFLVMYPGQGTQMTNWKDPLGLKLLPVMTDINNPWRSFADKRQTSQDKGLVSYHGWSWEPPLDKHSDSLVSWWATRHVTRNDGSIEKVVEVSDR